MKSLISSFLFFIIANSLWAQDPQVSFELSDPISPFVTKDYVASEYIHMIPNFWAHPNDEYYQVSAKINPLLVFPPDDGVLTGGASTNNNGGVVGTLPGNLMVSPTGAAVYNIPIELPSGVAGMTPQLGLVYNSQGGNGLLGIGWSLSGLSAITRTGTTIYNDGYIDGVDFDGNDQYMLDGQRLIPINSEETEFRTEIETFSKITAIGTAGDGPEQFLVKTKSGQILYYGSQSTGRIEAEGRTSILTWCLNRMEDRQGNYIDFSYTETGGMGIIDEINYGGNSQTGQLPFYSVKFVYDGFRNDKITNYIDGGAINIDRLLNKIEIYYGTTKLKNYILAYDKTFYARLADVWLRKGDQNTPYFNPTICHWGPDNDHTHVELTANEDPMVFGGGIDQFFLDINGDGLTDVIKIEWQPYGEYQSIQGKEATDWYYRLRQPSGGFSSKMNFPVNTEPSTYFNTLMVGDFNGDGLQDFLDLKYEDEDKEKTIVNRLFLSEGTEFQVCQLYGIEGAHVNHPEFRVGDFDGDGISELLSAYKDKNVNYDSDPNNDEDDVFVWKFSADSPYAQAVFWGQMGFGNTDFYKSIIVVGDFNGNGRSDILRTAEWGSSPGGSNTSDCMIYSVDIPSGEFDLIYGGAYPTVWHQIFPADFNGDGITDLLTYNFTSTNPTWEATCFNGSSGFVPMEDAPPLADFDPYDYTDQWSFSLNIADFNGDGKSDVMQLEKIDNTNSANYDIYYSNGNNFNESSSDIITIYGGFVTSAFIQNQHIFPYFDFNGDAHADMYIDGGFWGDLIYQFDINNQFSKVKDFTNGFGVKTEIQYDYLTNNSIYTKADGATYPLMDIQAALTVVSSISSDNGIGGMNEVKYRYEGAKLHKQGKGFLGFDKITTTSNSDTDYETKVVANYALNEDFYFRWPESSLVFLQVGSIETLISESMSEDPVIENFGNKRIFYYTPRALSKVHSTGDVGSLFVSTTLTKQSFSPVDIQIGNITSATVFTDPENFSFSAPEQAYDYYSKSEFTYNIDETNWLISRKETETISTWDKTDPTIDVKQNVIIYYPGSPLIQSVTHIPNSSATMTTVDSYVYDDYGNVTQNILSAPNFTPAQADQVTNFIYSSEFQHRFVTESKKVVSGVDYVTSTDYDPVSGFVTTTTDLNGLATTYSYDDFGRLEQTIFPDGITDKSLLFWADGNSDNPEKGLFYSWTKRSGEMEIMVFSDQLGRKLRTVNFDIKGQKVFNETIYNQWGQVSQSSNPHFSTSDLLWTTYDYLASGAIKTITSPTATIEYTYNGLITNIENTTLGIVSSKETNAIGQVVKSTDPGGAINYTYYGSGQPKTIAAGGNTTMLYYDAAGFQERMIEPDAGTVLYSYSPFGALVSQTNANMQKYSMSYDVLGRITNKSMEGSLEDIITYIYCPFGTNGFGQLQSVTYGNGIQTSYKYDALARVVEKNTLIDGVTYTYTYDYNIYGKSQNTTWPTGFSIKNRYRNGYLSAVEENATGRKLWELTDVNARGQVTQYQLGNGLLTTKGYDQYGFPSTIYTEGGVQDLSYGFNVNSGNLNWRTSVLSPPYGNQTLTENFTYDEDKLNNRLLTWQIQGGTLYSVNYSDNGNINTKSGVGTFNYSTGDAGPHALSRITEPSADYLNMAKNNKQVLTYTGNDKTATIWQGDPNDPEEADYLQITYGPGQVRKKSQHYRSGALVKTKIFVDGSYEIEKDANNKQRQLHYISGGDGLFAIYVIDSDGKECMYYIHKDYLGSYETITSEQGSIVEKLSFDPWGKRRNPHNWTFTDVPDSYTFDRGYTGHEHLDAFALINMNGRMYEPLLGRFLSPDNFVQSPDYTQNFNRYSYVMNNPLKYTDPSGEVFKIFAFGGAFIADYLSNLVNGWSDPAGLAYKNASSTVNGMNSCAQIPVYNNTNTSISAGLDPFSAGLSIEVNINNGNTMQNFHAGYGFLGWDIGGSTSFKIGDFTASFGGGYSVGIDNILKKEPLTISGTQYYSGISYFDRNWNQNLSFGFTSFFGEFSQHNWYIGYGKGDFSFAMTNDALTGSDWYRTAAAEVGIGEMSFGFNLFTTEPPLDEYISNPHEGGNFEYFSPIHGKNDHGTYSSGSRVYAGMYLGYRSSNRVSRFGIDAGWVQDLFQNGIHRWIWPTPYFNTNYGPSPAPFLQGGYVAPFSLYAF